MNIIYQNFFQKSFRLTKSLAIWKFRNTGIRLKNSPCEMTGLKKGMIRLLLFSQIGQIVLSHRENICGFITQFYQHVFLLNDH